MPKHSSMNIYTLKQQSDEEGNSCSTVINEGTDDEFTCCGYKISRWRCFLTYTLVACTAGFFYLFLYWQPNWKIWLLYQKWPLHSATVVLNKDKYDRWMAKDIKHIPTTERLQDDNTDNNSERSWERKILLSSNSSTADNVIHENNGVKYFNYQKLRYIWNDASQAYVRLRGLDAGFTTAEIYSMAGGMPTVVEDKSNSQQCETFSTDMHKIWITSSYRRFIFGENTIKIRVKSYSRLFIEEVLSALYIFQLFSVCLWMSDEYYYYAGCILIMSIVSITKTLYSTKKQMLSLRRTVAGGDKVNVCRGGQDFENVWQDTLIPGDVIEIPRHGCVMSCDAILLSGNCIVNESALTGESVPVMKTNLPNHTTENVTYSLKHHQRHTLYCGTKVIQARYYGNEIVRAIVSHTGYMTAKGDMVRAILYPKPLTLKLERDSMKFVAVLACLALVGFLYSVILKYLHGEPASEIALESLDVITIAIPPALPVALTVGIAYAQTRLKAKKVFCISPQRINICGYLDVICFDKTGTLTEDSMDLLGVLPVLNNMFSRLVKDITSMPYSDFIAGMACCHSITKIDNELSGDPLDLKMFESVQWVLEEPETEGAGYETIAPVVVKPPSNIASNGEQQDDIEIGIIRQFPFMSELQRMSVIIRHKTESGMVLFVKGSPEMICSLCMKDTVPADFTEQLGRYTKQGYRVIALACKNLGPKLPWHKAMKVTRDKLECDLTFLGLIIMQNRLKPESTPVIQELKAANIRTVMITGDNVLTAMSVARECTMVHSRDQLIFITAENSAEEPDGIPPKISFMFTDSSNNFSLEEMTISDLAIDMNASSGKYHFAVSGDAYSVIVKHYPELLPKILVRGCVFARMSPDQKAQLVESLQELDYYVGMCGDGANDCGALRTAHAGVALSELEASVASSFTSKRDNIECIPDVIKEGRSSLVGSFAVFKYMALYSIIQYVSILIMYWLLTILGDVQFMYIDIFIITLITVTMGRTAAYSKIADCKPLESLVGPAMLFSVGTQVIIQITFQVIVVILLKSQSWFVPIEPQLSGDAVYSYENAAVFLISLFQYIIVAAIFSKGPPFRLQFWTNYWYLAVLVICTIVSIVILFLPEGAFMDSFMQVYPLPWTFRLYILGIAAANFVISAAFELYVVEMPSLKEPLRFLCCRRKKMKKYQRIETEVNASKSWLSVSSINMSSSHADILVETNNINANIETGTAL